MSLPIADCTRLKPHENPCNGWATVECYGADKKPFEVSEARKESYYGACRRHCCATHGCKYGLKDCPVVFREVDAEDPDSCEQCMKLSHHYEEL